MRFSSWLSVILSALLVLKPLPAQTPANSAPLAISVVNNDGSVTAAGARAQRGFTLQITDSSGAPVSDAAVVLRFPDAAPTATFTDGTHAAVAYTDATGRAEVSGMQWSTEPGLVPIKVTATKGAAHAGTILEQQLNAVIQVASSKEIHPAAVIAQPERTESAIPKLNVESTSVAVPRPGMPSTPERIPSLAPAISVTPSVSVVNRPSSEKLDGGGGHKKWIILLVAIAAGAGAGIALAGKKSSSSSANTSTSTGTTVGAPTINVGAP